MTITSTLTDAQTLGLRYATAEFNAAQQKSSDAAQVFKPADQRTPYTPISASDYGVQVMDKVWTDYARQRKLALPRDPAKRDAATKIYNDLAAKLDAGQQAQFKAVFSGVSNIPTDEAAVAFLTGFEVPAELEAGKQAIINALS